MHIVQHCQQILPIVEKMCFCICCRYGMIVLIVEVIGVSSMLPYGVMLVCYTVTTGSR
jgi:hypothetical protein